MVAPQASTPPDAAIAPLPLALRVLSGVGGVVVYILGFAASVGAIVAAPLGMWLVRRRAQRRGLPVGRIAALVASVSASMALAIALWSLLFMLIHKPTPSELKSVAAEAQQRRPVRLPDWYTKAFPQAARYDSASRAMVESPSFMRIMFIVTGVMLGGLFGTIGGVFGWCGSFLLSLAWSGGRAERAELQ